jgi:hypothetical protein
VTAELVPRDLGPGLVQPGFSETLLERIAVIESPRLLYDGSAYLAGLAQKWNGHGAEKNEIKAAQMFCEVRLGQLLGPNPGHGPGRGIKDSDGNVSSLPLPPRAVTDFRRYLGHFDPLVEAVRNGKRSRRSLLLLVDELEAADRATDRLADGMPAEPTYAELEIRCGDFREVLQDIEPGTVNLILTDPPYPTEYLPLWTDLGKWGAQALCEGGSLIAYCGQSILPDVLNRLNEHLRYWWTPTETRLITDKQLTKLAIELNKAVGDGKTDEDRQARHDFVAQIIGRPITSAKELTFDEAHDIIDILVNDRESTADAE